MITLVLLPGLDGTGLLFGPIVDRLANGIEPLIVRFPGDTPLGYRELLPVVEKRLPAGPFVLLGESFSGPLAVMVAAKRPQNLRGLILCASFVRSPAAWLPNWCASLVRPYQFRLYPIVARARLLFGRFADPAVRRLAEKAVASARRDVLAQRIREVHRVDVSEQLRSCNVPVLYLRGTKDLLVRKASMRHVLEVYPQTQVSTLLAPHMVLQSEPAAAGAVICSFIQAVGAV